MQQICEGVWGVEGQIKLGPGFYLPIRTTVLATGAGLVVISPIQPGAWMEEVERLGPVGWIVAPNAFHHLFVGDAVARWPGAVLVAASRLQQKRPDLRAQHWLSAEAPEAPPFPDVALLTLAGAPNLCETVFFHEPSKTVVLTDVVFNLHQTSGWLTPWVLRVVGAHQRLAQSRLSRSQVKDVAAYGRSAARCLAWPIERIVPAHGDVLSEGARDALAAALLWATGEGM